MRHRAFKVATIAAIAWLFALFSMQMVKYKYPDSLDSAMDVPGWMVDGQFGTFNDADMGALRKGECSHDPIFVRPKADGSAVLTCGLPAQPGPVKLFVVGELEPQAETPRH